MSEARIFHRFRIGDRVVKNPATWQPSEFDGWGSGEGVGVVVEPPWEHDDGLFDGNDIYPSVDVRWPTGRRFNRVDELLPAPNDEGSKMEKATWREMIEREMSDHGETIADLVHVSPTDLDMDREFDFGWGSSSGKPFTLWTADRVYFPVVYDGAEWVGSVPRDPCEEVAKHFGSE